MTCYPEFAENLSATVGFLSLVLAAITVCVAYDEFQAMKRHKQCDVLTQYHQRYAEDESIQRVVKFVVNTSVGEFVEKEETPSVHDKEMFLRFFEEVSLMIEQKYLDFGQVKELFTYYFYILWKDDTFFWDDKMRTPYPTMLDAQSNNWNYAKKLFDKLEESIDDERQGCDDFLRIFLDKYRTWQDGNNDL